LGSTRSGRSFATGGAPISLHELKSGARVVSNSFDMGDWKPDKVVKLTVAGSECVIYYWAIASRRKTGNDK